MKSEFRSPMPEAVRPDGDEPEQTYFADPAVDRLMGVVMNLATEVFVLRERCAAQEAQLAGQGVLNTEQLSAEPTAEQIAQRTTEQQAFVRHLLEPLSGRQVTRPAN